jgi:sRNA-binding regulator protein Hfq
MNGQSILPGVESQRRAETFFPTHRRNQSSVSTPPFRFTNYEIDENSAHRQAEQFYLQKQIQSQTPMVVVMEDGERLEGQIEWYDRGVLKIRGRAKVLIYKSAIRYMYKLAEVG